MNQLQFKLDPTLPATPFVSQTLKGGKTVAITFSGGKATAIFVQQSADGETWRSKQSISPTPSAQFNILADSNTYLRIVLAARPLKAEYEDYNPGGGGGTGTVKSVNGVQPDANGNVEITVGGATYATNSDIDALWK